MIHPPAPENDYGFYNRYVSRSNHTDLLSGFEKNTEELKQMIGALTEEQLLYRYDADKWNIKEVLIHLIDAERNFCYRAMRISRGDQTNIPPFDAHQFTHNSYASQRDISGIMRELEITRNATVAMYEHMPAEMLDKTGPARDIQISVRALGFATIGHAIHHMDIIKERYMPAFATMQQKNS